jgi:hypothetical protein
METLLHTENRKPSFQICRVVTELHTSPDLTKVWCNSIARLNERLRIYKTCSVIKRFLFDNLEANIERRLKDVTD